MQIYLTSVIITSHLPIYVIIDLVKWVCVLYIVIDTF